MEELVVLVLNFIDMCVRVSGWYSGIRLFVCLVVMMVVMWVMFSMLFFLVVFDLMMVKVVGCMWIMLVVSVM